MSRLLRAERVCIREPLEIPLSELPAPEMEDQEQEEQGEQEEELMGAPEALLAAARAQAEQIRRRASQDADKLYAQARREAEEEGRRLGFSRGERAGREELHREAQRQEAWLCGRVGELKAHLAQTREDIRRRAMNIGFALAGHILRAEIDRKASQFDDLAREILPDDDEAGDARQTVRVSAHVRKGGDAVA